MPTKLNRAGNQQNYVPAGNGDASGEYGDNATGSNKNFTTKKQEPENPTRKLVLEKNGFDPENMSEKQKQETFVRLGGEDNWANKAYDVDDEDMKSVDYTQTLVNSAVINNYFGETTQQASVHISRGSLTKNEIGELNKSIKKLYDEYPEIQKFTSIETKKANASFKGGHVSVDGTGKKKAYGLYINTAWLEKTPSEKYDEQYKSIIENNIKELKKDMSIKKDDVDFIKQAEEKLEKYKNTLKNIENKPKSTTVSKVQGRDDRLKAILSHELMHRITMSFDDYNINKYVGNIEKNNKIQKRHNEIKNLIKDTYIKALQNGDARNISTYATTSREEFISEANAQLELGIETPEYIGDMVKSIKSFLRSEE